MKIEEAKRNIEIRRYGTLSEEGKRILDVVMDALEKVEIIESTLEPLLGRLGKMAKDIEYMHNFQNEREDIVKYIYKTHDIIKLLKEELK